MKNHQKCFIKHFSQFFLLKLSFLNKKKRYNSLHRTHADDISGKNGQIDQHFPISIDHCKLIVNDISICSYNFNNEVITIKKYLLNALKLNGHHKLELHVQWYWKLHYGSHYILCYSISLNYIPDKV